MFKTWFYTNIYNAYTNYCLILRFQSLSCSLLVILYYIRPICYAVSGWVFTSSCYSFVICLYFYNTSQGHSVDLQLFFIFFAITVPDNIWFIQHFYIFFIINFCIFYHVKKISMSERTSIIWEIKDGVDSVGGVDGMHL